MGNSCKTIEVLNKATTSFLTSRVILCIILGICLLLAGIYSEPIYKILTEAYHKVFLLFGLSFLASKPQAGISTLITKHSLPAIATYGIGYVLLSFLFLHVYFSNFRKSLLTIYFYASVFLVCLLLIALGKSVPALQESYKLARHLIEFIISPFPVIFLVAAFKAFSSNS